MSEEVVKLSHSSPIIQTMSPLAYENQGGTLYLYGGVYYNDSYPSVIKINGNNQETHFTDSQNIHCPLPTNLPTGNNTVVVYTPPNGIYGGGGTSNSKTLLVG